MADNQSASYESHLVMETRKRRVLSINEKIELIRLTEVASKKEKKAIAAKFKIPVHSLNTIYASREKFFEKYTKGNFGNMNLKRLRPSNYPDIEKSLFEWYMENHVHGHISGLALREKALQLAKTYGHENFSASYGWIERFKSRHNLKFRKNEDISSTDTNLSKDDSFLDADKSDISQGENSLEAETCDRNQQKINEEPSWENVHNHVMQLVEINQECNDDKNLSSESHCPLDQNDDETVEMCLSPSHILPEVQLTEANLPNVNSLVNNSNNVKAKTNFCNFSIHDVESAFNVVCNYIKTCDENVNQKTFEALNTLNIFIMKEKQRKAQSKITDYFSYLNKCRK